MRKKQKRGERYISFTDQAFLALEGSAKIYNEGRLLVVGEMAYIRCAPSNNKKMELNDPILLPDLSAQKPIV